MPQATSDGELSGIPDAETDAGPPRAGKAGARDPERRCIVTMERRQQGELIRFALSPDNQVTPDLAAKLPGRGAWVTASRDSIDLAVKKGAFHRAFKKQVKVAPDLAGQVEQLLVKRILDQLGMVKRAGDLILGFEQVREEVRKAPPAFLIEASDGSEDQRGKVLALVRGLYTPDLDEAGKPAGNLELPPVAGCFLASELGMALGRDRVIHACVKYGRIAHAWRGELERLSGFRRVWLPGWQPSSATGQKISDDTTTRVSGGAPPATPVSTELTNLK
ncbi:MAG: RNA-binding protein [Hyphomonadaceae bacterium]|nr:RNA-binding protein [Hyphomonadaceae bacterium]